MNDRNLVQVEVAFWLAGSDLERLVVVGDHLEFLAALPRDRLPTHTEVRLAAGAMRRLLVESELVRLWRTPGAPRDAQLAVRALDLDTPREDRADD